MKTTKFLTAILAGALTLGACSDDNLTGGAASNRLTIQLTDAPGDLKEVFVKIEKIVLLRSGNDTTTASNKVEITPEVTGWVNLLELAGGKLRDLADTTGIADGTYTELRVVIDEAYIKLNDNRVFATAGSTLPSGLTAVGTLKCPSCSSSGFKVKFTNGGLVINGTSTVVIDFDAGQSFGHEAGKSGQWIMKPVLRATAKTVAFAKITGTVSLASAITIPTCGGQSNGLRSFKPFARLNSDTLSAVVDSTGAYRVSNATPGTYTMGYAADVTFTNGDSLTFAATPTPATVTVAAADSAKANYQITAATCH